MSSKKGAKKPLTDKQEKFAEEYVRSGNATDAARKAGYSPKTAKVQASRLLTNANLSEIIEQRREDAKKQAQVHTDVIIGSLFEIATASLADVNPDDEFLKKARANKKDHLIKKVKVNYDKQGNVTSREYEMYSRLEALSQLRDTFGMKQEPRPNDKARVESAIQDFIRVAGERGYRLSYEEARGFIEPRMVSELAQ